MGRPAESGRRLKCGRLFILADTQGGVYKEKSDAELLAGKNARIVRLTEPDDELLKAAEEIVASIPSVLVSLSEMIGDAYTPVKTSCLDALCAAVKNGRAG